MPTADTPLGTGNIGFRMMQKLGWQGQGLGQNERGIREPVRAADARERSDKYKV